jgi:KDO2-lipid IV(A) lauroyltransferase
MSTILYYLLSFFTRILAFLPFTLLYLISDLLYLIIRYIAKYRINTVINNLRSSFPEKTDQEIHALTKAFYRHFSDFILESLKCISISAKQLDRRMKLINPEIFDDLRKTNTNFALVSAHYNNWEWGMSFPRYMIHDLLIIYRPLKSKPVDHLTHFMRSRFGAKMIAMEGVYREARKYQTMNLPFGVWFLADQRPPRNSRFWTTFLNHETAFFEGVEKMSKKLGLAVIFLDIRKVRRGHYEVHFKKLFDNASTTSENEVTLACVKEMEQEIMRKPEYWLWSHKRFKHSRPEEVKLIAR